MVSVQSPPRARELPYARVLLPPAILLAAATGAAVALVPDAVRLAVGVCGAVAALLLLATAAQVVRRGREIRALRAEHARHSAYLEQRIAAHDEEIVRLGSEIIPAALEAVRGDDPGQVMRKLIDAHPELRHIPPSHRAVVRTRASSSP